MPGSGKDTLSQAIKERGYKVIVMSEVLKERYAKEALPGERLMDFAFRMRRERGRGFVAELPREAYGFRLQNEEGKGQRVRR